MTTRILLACGILAGGIVYAVVADDQSSVGLDAGGSKITRDTTNRIEQALQERSDCNFVDTRLEESLQILARVHGIPIWLDKQSLHDEGIVTDTPLHLVMSGITLQTALSLSLEPLGLAYLIEDGVLKIMTQAKVQERFSRRVYPVADLVTKGDSPQDYRFLIEALQNSTPGLSREADAGSCTAFPNARSLVITLAQPDHRIVAGLLAALRKVKRLERIASIPVNADQSSVGLDTGDAKITRDSANRIEQALRERSDCNFVDTPLEESLQTLARVHGIPIWLDKQTLVDEGITADQQITLVMSGITLQTVLSLSLKPQGLTYLIENGVLKITTQAHADERLSTRVYPIADLITKCDSPEDYASLVAVIMSSTHGPWLLNDGEGGTVVAFPNARSLVLHMTQLNHRVIEGVLAGLRKARQLQQVSLIPVNADASKILNPVEPSSVGPCVRIRAQRAKQTWRRSRVHSAE